MSRSQPGPSPLERARQGDRAALASVLEGVLAPLFDAACHVRGAEDAAAEASVEALALLALTLLEGRDQGASPLSLAARALFQGPCHPPARDDPTPAAGSDGTRLRHVTEGLSGLAPEVWCAVVGAFALNLAGEEWQTALACSADQGETLARQPLQELKIAQEELQGFLDRRAARWRLPGSLVEEALDRLPSA